LQGLLDGLLHASCIALPLPAVEPGTVVLNAERDAAQVGHVQRSLLNRL
jgi:hypothetical protein